MFAEWLDAHSLKESLKNAKGFPYPDAGDRQGWESLDEDIKQQIRQMAERYRRLPYPMCSATQYLAYVRSGSRQAMEKPYFDRRRKLAAAVTGYCLDRNAEDLDAVIDGIWCICEETSWVISAHNINPIPGAQKPEDYPLPDPQRPYIDLFAAQTGMILSFTLRLMSEALDRVSPVLCRRIRAEIEKRIIIPFISHDDFWWMGFIRKDLCNWTPWIVSNILMTSFCILNDPERLAEITGRACLMLDRWLAVVPEDGGCDEGAAYWNMAGGSFLDCLELLENVTGGAMNFRDDRKTANILRYPLRAMLRNGWFVNFADCDARPRMCGERLQLAGEWLSDAELIRAGVALRGTVAEQIDAQPHFGRLLQYLFHPAVPVENVKNEEKDVWLENLQLRVLEKGRLILVAKGGHNGESHNHNDVGSFMLYVDGEPAIVDAGNMVYTAKTFSSARYELWNIRSAWHNLPLIGGKEQHDGRIFAAGEARKTDRGLETEISGAWQKEAGVTELRRSAELNENRMLLKDDIHLDRPLEVSWVLMLRHKPEVDENHVVSGKIRFDLPEGNRVSAEEIPVTDSRMAENYPGSLWRLMITRGAADRQTLSLNIMPV